MAGKMKNFNNKQFLIAAIGDEVLRHFSRLNLNIADNHRTSSYWNGRA